MAEAREIIVQGRNGVMLSEAKIHNIIEKVVRNSLRTLCEHYIRQQYINENNIDELDVMHASPNKFDRFNHKKHLGQGTGSQSFGWGSYFSSNKDVINGYLDNFKDINKHDQGLYLLHRLMLQEFPLYIDNKLYYSLFVAYENLFEGNQQEVLSKLNKHYEKVQEMFTHFIKNPIKTSTEERLIMFYRLPRRFYGFRYDSQNKSWTYHGYPYEKMSMDVYRELTSVAQEYYKKMKNFFIIMKMFIEKYNIFNETNSIYKYSVHIPDENDDNYIEWYENLKNSQIEKISNGLEKLRKRYPSRHLFNRMLKDFYENEIRYERFRDIYYWLTKKFGSQKAASMFLQYCGFDGIKYPPYTRYNASNGKSKDGHNYVIFDQNKAKIINVEEY